jgi:hypothetical protein
MAYAVFYDHRLGAPIRPISKRMPMISPPSSVAARDRDEEPGAG